MSSYNTRYRIYFSNWEDGVKFDYPLLDRDQDIFIKNPKLIREVNALEQLTFTIYPNHPYYSYLKLKESVIKVYKTTYYSQEKIIFKGRIIKEKSNFDKSKNITCEGILSTLVDNYYSDWSYSYYHKKTSNFIFDCNFGTTGSPTPARGLFNDLIVNFNNENCKEADKIQIGEICPRVPKNDNLGTGLAYSYKAFDDKTKLIDKSVFDEFSGKNLLEILNLLIENAVYLGGTENDKKKYALKYFYPTYDEDKTYLNIYSDYDLEENQNIQEIEFGDNLIDIFFETEASSIITAIIPTGEASVPPPPGEENWETVPVDITYWGSGTVQYKNNPDIFSRWNYMFSKSAVDKYGWIVDKPENTVFKFFDKGSNTANVEYLEEQAANYLQNKTSRIKETVTVDAADLSFAAQYKIPAFDILKYVTIKTPKHLGGDGTVRYLITRIDYNLLEPEKNKISFKQTNDVLVTNTPNYSPAKTGMSGNVAKSSSEATTIVRDYLSTKKEIGEIKGDYATNEYVSNVQSDLNSYIDQSSDEILASVREDPSITKTAIYYQVVESTAEGALLVVADDVELEEGQIHYSDVSSCDCGVEIGDYVILVSASMQYEALKQTVQNLVSQTSDAVQLNFLTETVLNAINEAAGEVDSKYSFVKNYFRFDSDGSLLIGTVDSPFILKLTKNRISFLEDGVEVAYISNNKLFITEAEILNSLDIGGFSFVPRANGNLSFRLK